MCSLLVLITYSYENYITIIIIIIIIITAIQFSLGGSSPYTSTDKTNNIHKRNNTKTQYKQYKTQQIEVHILPKHTHTHTQLSKHPHITKPVKTTTVQNILTNYTLGVPS